LGLAVARLGETAGEVAAVAAPPITRTDRMGGSLSTTPAASSLRVVDLSSLWARPPCGQLLEASGMPVVKVERSGRPDGAGRGRAEFFDLLNAGKESVVLDLDAAAGLGSLRALLEWADVVIESSRPRALQQLGIDAARLVAESRPRVWLSITGYGREGSQGR